MSRLEKDYAIIKKFNPIGAKPGSKVQKYHIIDNFLKFWFRFFHRYRDAIEIHNYEFIKTVIQRDFSSYSGKLLEKFFFELLAATKQYNRMGSYWEHGHKNEIDIVAINELEKKLLIAEVKTHERRNSLTRLQYRAIPLLKQYPDYQIQYEQLSLADAKQYLKG